MDGFPRAWMRAFALLVLATTAWLLAGAGVAQADVPYTSEPFAGCGGFRGASQTDASGRLYLPCQYRNGVNQPNIRVYAADGTLAQTILMPALPGGGNGYAADIAPSPDGSYLYFSQHATKTFYRLVRQAGGGYAFDTTWRFARFPMDGTMYDPRGEFLQTDAAGNVYISVGTWAPGGTPSTVVKYTADGAFITRFGTYGYQSRALGEFYWMLTGLSVTPDGSTVYTTEVGNNRVQRWTRNFADAGYTAVEQYGNTEGDDPTRGGICGIPGKFAAPYGSALDSAGSLFVINTSCASLNLTEIHKYSGGTWQLIRGAKYNTDFQHAIAIGANGTIYIPSTDVLLRPDGGQPPLPQPDTVAPQLAAATLPATSTTRDVPLSLVATDAVGVTQVRVAEGAADISTAPWRAYAASIAVQLSDGSGAKTLKVQVRDAAGNLSAVVTAQTTLTIPPPPATNTAPVLRDVLIPNPATTQTIPVAIDAVDDVAVTQVRFASEGGIWGAWQPYATSVPFTLTAGLGNRGVFVQVRDAAGLESDKVYKMTLRADAPADPLPADTVAPTLRAVNVPATVTTRMVRVTLDATDDRGLTGVRVALDGGDINASQWRAYAGVFDVEVPDGAGPKTITVQVRDAAGNQSLAMAAHTQYAPGPVVEPPVPAGPNTAPILRAVTIPAQTNTSAITVAIDATDDVAVAQMRMATEAGFWGAWQPFNANAPFTLTAGTGARGVFVQVRDAAGLESGSMYRTTLVVAGGVIVDPPQPGEPDAGAPTITRVTVPATTATRAIAVGIAAIDDRAVTGMRLANEDGIWTAWQAYAPTVAWTLTPVSMTKGVFVQVRDAAGHESGKAFVTLLCAPCQDTPQAGLRAVRMLTAQRTAATRVRRATFRADRVHGTARAEHFNVSQRDGRRDIIDCGGGYDTVLKQPEDVTRGCERVRVVRQPRP